MPKHISKRKIAVAVIVIGILLVGVFLVFGQSIFFPGPHYVLNTNGTTCWAVADNGATITSNIDATLVLETVLNASSSGSSILIQNGVFTAYNSVTIPYDRTSISFNNAVWRMANGAVKFGNPSILTEFKIFNAENKSGLSFDFVNSYIDCNMANQYAPSPSNNAIAGIYLYFCDNINIPNFKVSGVGSSKCHGWGVCLDTCQWANTGYMQGDAIGDVLLEMKNCKHITCDRLQATHFAEFDNGGSVWEVFSMPDARSLAGSADVNSYDISVNSVIGDNTGVNQGFVGRLGAVGGDVHSITIGSFTGRNTGCGSMQIDNLLSPTSQVYDVTIGTINQAQSTGMDIYSKGLSIFDTAPTGQYLLHDITINQFSSDISYYDGLYIEGAKNVAINNFHIENAGGNGITVRHSDSITLKGSLVDCGNGAGMSDGIVVWETTHSTITVDSIVDDRTVHAMNYGIQEYGLPAVSGFNTFYVTSISGSVKASAYPAFDGTSNWYGTPYFQNSGRVNVPNGASSIMISHGMTFSPKTVHATSGWNTNCWVAGFDQNTITIDFGTPASGNLAFVDWSATVNPT